MHDIANSPWVAQEAKKAGPVPEQVPDGGYMATFKGVENAQVPPKPGDDGVRWRFLWEVTDGQQAGLWASALCDRTITPGTLAGRLIAGLLGRQFVVGENVQAAVNACVGETYFVIVQRGPQGGKSGVKAASLPPT
jgi:hypothetical protein